jgi:hemerythrin-like domain-containing protein
VKRSSALAPLSRDHHHALVIASALSRATEATAGSAARLFEDFIAEHERVHFALEESLLLPALPEGARGRLLAERVRQDHRHLEEMAKQLERDSVRPTAELAHSIGVRLRGHVQMEERELFPYLERVLDPAALERIGERLIGGR